MENRILFGAGLRRHKGSLAGVFVLLFLVSLALGTVLTVWSNSGRYISSELERAGFGKLTAWVSNVPDADTLAGEISFLPDVTAVETQRLIFSNYEIGEQESDSEGQLIPLAPGETRYRFFTDDLSAYRGDVPTILPGEVYVPPSLVSIFGVELGGEIIFPIARAGGNATFTVKGFYEAPFMGSSMIGIKDFLICQEDYNALTEIIQSSGFDALARDGAMLYIFSDGDMTTSELNQTINEQTSLPAYTEFVHTAQAIRGFMLILQNASFTDRRLPAVSGNCLSLQLAVRQLLTAKRRYVSACAVAVLLVFFASMVGRIDAWLGSDGKGMMDAFNPADHDLGVQTFGTLDEAEAEQMVLSFTEITDSYVLAMPSVALNGVDYTANVIDQLERFHIS